MGQGHDTGPRCDHRRVQIEAPVVGHAEPTQRGPRAAGDLLPRDEIGVMLHLRDEDLVARTQYEPGGATVRCGVHEGIGDQIQGLRGVAREDHLCGGPSHETGHDRTRALVGVSGLLRELVCAAMHGSVVLLIEVPFGIDHLARLLGGRTGIEVDQAPVAAHRAFQDREILAQRVDVQQGHPATPAPMNCS